MNSPANRGTLLALLAFGSFATHDALIKVLGGQYTVFQIIFFSVLFSFVPMTIALTADTTVANLRPRHPWLVAIRTAMMIIGMVSAFFAFTRLPLAQTYALLFATPLLITALSIPFLGEKVGLRRWLAVIIGLVGVVIVLRPGAIPLELGHVAALVAALASAVSSIIVRRAGPEERSAVLILYPMIANVAVMAVILPLVYVPMPLRDLALIATVGLLATTGQFLIVAAYKTAPAARVAPMQYSQILWAVPFGVLLFADFPDIWVGVGSAVIIASGLFIVWRENQDQVSQVKPMTQNPNHRPDIGPATRIRFFRRRARKSS